MYRSGSTWQYNAVRLITKGHRAAAPAFVKGIRLIDLMDSGDVILKIHEYFKMLVDWADFVLTSHRNPHEILASSLLFNLIQKDSIKRHIELIRRHYDYHLRYTDVADYNMNFVDLLNDQRLVIHDLCGILGVTADVDDVARQLDAMTYDGPDCDPITLLHKDHRTNCKPSIVNVAVVEEHFEDIMQLYCFHYPVV